MTPDVAGFHGQLHLRQFQRQEAGERLRCRFHPEASIADIEQLGDDSGHSGIAVATAKDKVEAIARAEADDRDQPIRPR